MATGSFSAEAAVRGAGWLGTVAAIGGTCFLAGWAIL